MLQLRWIPFQIACAASLFGGALYIRRWLKEKQQPLSLIYDERLEDASNFDLGSYYDMVEKKLIEISNRKLKLQKFLLNTSYYDKLETQVTSLIRYALRSQVEELDLSFWLKCGPYVELPLDDFFFFNSHLTHLNFSFNIPNRTHTVCWENLKSLCLSNINLTEDFFQKILSGSPVLETFKLDSCYGEHFYHLDIISNSVKFFEVSGNRELQDAHGRVHGCVLLNAPNIISLTIKGSLVLSQLHVFDVDSLVEATIDYYDEDDFGEGLTDDDVEEMIYRHVKILGRACGNGLKLGEICLEVNSRVEAKGSCQEDYAYEYIEDLSNAVDVMMAL